MIGHPYRYVAVETVKNDEGRDVESKIIIDGTIMAKTPDQARMIVARLIPASHDDNIDNVEIFISPFV